MAEKPTVEQLLRDKGKELDLRLLAGVGGLRNRIDTPELNRPGLALAGFFEVFAHNRIQIMGITELSFLRSLEAGALLERLDKFFSFPIPCIIITSGQTVEESFLGMANEHNCAVLVTSLNTSNFLGHLARYLEWKFAPTTTVHGTLLDVYGLGVLIMGKSGVGKSECALDLVERGHRLVADDAVILKRLAKDLILGTRSAVTQHHMEVRGLGIIDVESLFGAGSVREEKKVSLVVSLERWDNAKSYDRLGLDENFANILEVRVPEYVIPVESGRNLSILIEVAALTQRLKNLGKSPAEKFYREHLQALRSQSRHTPPADESAEQAD